MTALGRLCEVPAAPLAQGLATQRAGAWYYVPPGSTAGLARCCCRILDKILLRFQSSIELLQVCT